MIQMTTEKREKVKCGNCFHCERDPDFVDQSRYLIPDNRRESICEVQPGKKTKNNLKRYCELFKKRYIMENPTETYPQGQLRDIKRHPIGSREGDPGYTGPISTVEICEKPGNTFFLGGKCKACAHEEKVKNDV